MVREQERISQELELVGDDMDRMQALLDQLEKLNAAAVDMDVQLLDKKIDQMMPELGFMPQDNDRLVASYSGGWQMRMCLGKILLQVRAQGVAEGILACCCLPGWPGCMPATCVLFGLMQ